MVEKKAKVYFYQYRLEIDEAVKRRNPGLGSMFGIQTVIDGELEAESSFLRTGLGLDKAKAMGYAEAVAMLLKEKDVSNYELHINERHGDKTFVPDSYEAFALGNHFEGSLKLNFERSA